MFPGEVWALMADLSPAHAARVDSFFIARRAKQRSNRVASAMLAAGLNPRDVAPADIIARLDAEDREADAQWLAFREQVRAVSGRAGAGRESRHVPIIELVKDLPRSAPIPRRVLWPGARRASRSSR
jgi:hypothetical protein